jgi:hypothetical protein
MKWWPSAECTCTEEASLPLSVEKVLCIVSVGAGKRRREDDSTASQKPKPECVRGELGSLSKTGVPVQVDGGGADKQSRSARVEGLFA